MAGFWLLIEDARAKSGGDCDGMAAALESRLSSLTADEILDFQAVLNVYRAVTHKLESVFSLITGLPMSDDASDDFCMWLIKQGREICNAVWANPDVLADSLVDEDDGPACEPLLAVAQRAYREKTGEDSLPVLPNDPILHFLPESAALFPSLRPDQFLPPHESHGWKQWSEEELSSSCPKLWAKYGLRETGGSES